MINVALNHVLSVLLPRTPGVGNISVRVLWFILDGQLMHFFLEIIWLFKKKLFEEFEDTKGVIRIPKSKDRQHYGQKKHDKRTNGDLQNTPQKTKTRATQTPLKTGDEPGCSWSVSSSCSTSDTRSVTLVTKPVISHECGKDQEMLTTSGAYPCSFVTQIFRNG